jgi:hypothetical protein
MNAVARREAIVDAFDLIRLNAYYCDDWINVADWFRIICTEYDLIVQDTDFTAKDMHRALKKGTSSPHIPLQSVGSFETSIKAKVVKSTVTL